MSDNRPALVEPRNSNPFTPAGDGNARHGGAVAVEQQRAVAEVQAALTVAQYRPRDPVRAMDRILNSCTRVTLAERATYAYARGGTDISGPTIRIVEVFAQQWGNISCGVRELSRHDGVSECQAYAWDLESNFRDEKEFQVRLWRDRKQGGGYALTDERDIYELIANFGARRKRACILAVIPGDVVEAALDQCERTLHEKTDVSAEGIKKLITAFADFGVTVPQIEARIQRRLDAVRPAQIVMLRKIYNSLKDGMSDVADWFEAVPLVETTTTGQPAEPTPPPAGRRGRGRPATAAPTPTPTPAPPPAEPTPPPPPAETTERRRGRLQFEV